MTTHLRFDHAVILVNDLEKGTEDYRAFGFNVFYGGKHADGKTHNALIVFRDGTYLELLAPTDPTLLQSIDPSDQNGFLPMFQNGEGFGGYALLSNDLKSDVRDMQNRGTQCANASGGWTRTPGWKGTAMAQCDD